MCFLGLIICHHCKNIWATLAETCGGNFQLDLFWAVDSLNAHNGDEVGDILIQTQAGGPVVWPNNHNIILHTFVILDSRFLCRGCVAQIDHDAFCKREHLF